MLKKPILATLTVIITLALIYILLEVTFWSADHFMSYGIGGVKDGYQRYAKRVSRKPDGTIDFTSGPKRNVNLGWGSKERIDYQTNNYSFSVAFFGDSVTAGAEVKQDEAYTALLSDILRGSGVRVVNFAVAGYGLDQMLFKARSELVDEQFDLIVFSYIPHDLLRVGSDFMYSLPKPKLEQQSGVVTLKTADEVGDFYKRYDSAKRNFTFSLWAIDFLWRNRQYVVPVLYESYYTASFDYLVNEFDRIGSERGVPVVLAKLSNSTKFRGREMLEQIAENAVMKRHGQSSLYFYDMDECTREITQEEGADWERVFIFHPGPKGHKFMANCFMRMLGGRFLIDR